jgi:hypothetical protein
VQNFIFFVDFFVAKSACSMQNTVPNGGLVNLWKLLWELNLTWRYRNGKESKQERSTGCSKQGKGLHQEQRL